METTAVEKCENICRVHGGPRSCEFGKLVDELYRIFDTDTVNINEAKSILEAYISNPKHWKKFAKWDTYKYTRNLVDDGNGKFNLMLLCWPESKGSSVHDHHDSHCFYKVLSGELHETLYDWPNESEPNAPLKPKETTVASLNGVSYINDSMGIHRVENRSHTERAVSLHVYSPPFDECNAFDERSGSTRSAPVTFYSVGGKVLPAKERRLKKDVETNSSSSTSTMLMD